VQHADITTIARKEARGHPIPEARRTQNLQVELGPPVGVGKVIDLERSMLPEHPLVGLGSRVWLTKPIQAKTWVRTVGPTTGDV
jgi:hypothetical protein